MLEGEQVRKVRLFIAMSLDGYIADKEGSVHWLEGQGDSHEDIDVYSEFVKDIDTILMGWNTYHQVVTEFSPNEWIYSDFLTYVFTHRKCSSTEKIRFINENPIDFIKKLRLEKVRNGVANQIETDGEKRISKDDVSVK